MHKLIQQIEIQLNSKIGAAKGYAVMPKSRFGNPQVLNKLSEVYKFEECGFRQFLVSRLFDNPSHFS
jgi:hypothetical protein